MIFSLTKSESHAHVLLKEDHRKVDGLFKEFDTLTEPYKSKPLSTRVIQAHHGCQNALMKKFFGAFGYKGEEAPHVTTVFWQPGLVMKR